MTKKNLFMTTEKYIEEYFIPNMKSFFNIKEDDTTQDFNFKFLGENICQEALNFTNQTEIMEEWKYILLTEGIGIFKSYNGDVSVGTGSVKSITVGKTKIDYDTSGKVSTADFGFSNGIMSKSFYDKLLPFRRMRVLK